MLRWIGLWLSTAVGLAIVTQLGIGIHAQNAPTILWAAVALGVINLIVRPVVRLLALPINLITLGLFGWVINGLMLWLVAAVVPGFRVAGFVPAVEGAIVLAIISGGMHWILRRV